MSEPRDSAPLGGPLVQAFPQTPDSMSWGRGMTLRDYFAAKAMGAVLRNKGTVADLDQMGAVDFLDDSARTAYAYADAMLKARAA